MPATLKPEPARMLLRSEMLLPSWHMSTVEIAALASTRPKIEIVEPMRPYFLIETVEPKVT